MHARAVETEGVNGIISMFVMVSSSCSGGGNEGIGGA